jgi:hypothetical protein
VTERFSLHDPQAVRTMLYTNACEKTQTSPVILNMLGSHACTTLDHDVRSSAMQGVSPGLSRATRAGQVAEDM